MSSENRPISFKTKVHVFLDRTTLHGAHYLGQRGYHPIRRTIWLMIILSCTCAVIFLISQKIQQYMRWPVETKTSIRTESELEFPAVTICNNNPFRWSYVQQIPGLPEIFKLTYGPEELNNGEDIYSLIDLHQWEDMDNTMLYDAMAGAAHQLTDLFSECIWRGKEFDCERYFRPQWTADGRCYTFNGQDYIEEHGSPVTTDMVGVAGGLRLRLNVEQWEYGYGPYRSAGVRLLVHDPRDMPLMGRLATAIAPGMESYVGVQKTQLHSLPPPYEDSVCRDTLDRDFVNPLRYYRTYKYSTCMMECEARYLKDACDCRMYYHRGDDTQDICDPVDILLCAQQALVNFTRSASDSKCDCFQECDVLSFDVQVSSSLYPADFLVDEIVRDLNITEELIRKNLLVVQIFYVQLNYYLVDQVPGYGIESLIADVGGLLGLLLGASVITLLEFFDFITIIILEKMSIYQGGKPKRTPQKEIGSTEGATTA